MSMENKIKILQLITLGEQGGAQKHFLSLVNDLPADRYDITAACGGAGELLQKITRPEVKKVHIPELIREISPRQDLQAFAKITSLIKKEKFAIVHTHSSKAGVLGRLAAALSGTPIILFTAHGFVFLEPLPLFKKAIYFLAEKISAFWTTGLITVSARDGQVARRLISKNKISVIPNGLDPWPYTFEIRDEQYIRELGLDPAKKIIGAIANFYPTKGLKYLLEALASLKDPSLQLAIAGQGPLEYGLRNLAEKLNIKDQVFFLGERSDVPKLIRQFDLFVLPSLKEGFPYVVLEAMAAGRPIVSTNVGGIPEMLTDEAILVPPADSRALAEKIKSVLNDPGSLEKAAHYPEVIRNKFSEKIMLQKTEELYTSLAQRFLSV